MAAFYNEIEPYAAAWLRNLIREGLIADGEVCIRSIVDLRPSDVAGFTQCHFFAGLGGWSYAARLAGWPDDRPLWTGSCPCQPFSVAGKGLGADDPRHLWPHFFRLIRAARPPVVMGEQVAGAAGYGWLDGVVADLAAEGYAGRGVDIPACAVDAPHIRSRLYWVARAKAVADASGSKRRQDAEVWRDVDDGPHSGRQEAASGYQLDRAGDLADCHGGGQPHVGVAGLQRPDVHDADGRGERVNVEHAASLGRREGRPEHGVWRGRDAVASASRVRLDDADDAGLEGHAGHVNRGGGWPGAAGSVAATSGGDVADADLFSASARREQRSRELGGVGGDPRARDGRNGTPWSDAEWLTGADGKARRAQPGIRLLAHGIPARVGRLRAYGNAIVPQVAAEVIAAFMDTEAA